MPYPTIAAGKPATGALLAAMQPIEVIKPADQSVTASITLTNDLDLAVPVVSGATYRGVLTLYYLAPALADLSYAWTVPAGSAGRRGLLGPDQSSAAAVDLAAMQSRVSGSFTQAFRLGGADGSHKTAMERFLLVAGANGTLQLQFAQGTSNATAATILQYSHLALQRVS